MNKFRYCFSYLKSFLSDTADQHQIFRATVLARKSAQQKHSQSPTRQRVAHIECHQLTVQVLCTTSWQHSQYTHHLQHLEREEEEVEFEINGRFLKWHRILAVNIIQQSLAAKVSND